MVRVECMNEERLAIIIATKFKLAEESRNATDKLSGIPF